MGEIAEMLLDGTLCEGCGEFLGDAVGHTRRCAGCQPITLRGALSRSYSAASKRAARHNRERREVAKERKKFQCARCQKLFRTAEGAAQHARDKHQTEVA